MFTEEIPNEKLDFLCSLYATGAGSKPQPAINPLVLDIH